MTRRLTEAELYQQLCPICARRANSRWGGSPLDAPEVTYYLWCPQGRQESRRDHRLAPCPWGGETVIVASPRPTHHARGPSREEDSMTTLSPD